MKAILIGIFAANLVALGQHRLPSQGPLIPPNYYGVGDIAADAAAQQEFERQAEILRRSQILWKAVALTNSFPYRRVGGFYRDLRPLATMVMTNRQAKTPAPLLLWNLFQQVTVYRVMKDGLLIWTEPGHMALLINHPHQAIIHDGEVLSLLAAYEIPPQEYLLPSGEKTTIRKLDHGIPFQPQRAAKGPARPARPVRQSAPDPSTRTAIVKD